VVSEPAYVTLDQFLIFESNCEYGRCRNYSDISKSIKKSKIILVTGCEGTQVCDRLRLPHLLANRLTEGGKVVSLRRRPPYIPQEDSWYSFLLEAESTPGP
jgi:hypothetical protein